LANDDTASRFNRRLSQSILALALLGLMVPGLFGVKPPQWLGEDDLPPPSAHNTLQNVKPQDPAAQPDRKAAPLEGRDDFSPSKGDSGTAGPDGPVLPAKPEPQAKVDPPEIITVNRRFVEAIPDEHLELPTAQLKESFISITLPLILAANEEIVMHRMAIERALTKGDRKALENWAGFYKIKRLSQSDDALAKAILLRADQIPVALALAQAAVESGWGESRFALQGNALFGQWAWRESAGLKPLEASNDRAVVRSFPNLLESVRAYMRNLNTHQRYTEFRKQRAALVNTPEKSKAMTLVKYLDGYAEIGAAYVKKLQNIMRVNRLNRYAAATLR